MVKKKSEIVGPTLTIDPRTGVFDPPQTRARTGRKIVVTPAHMPEGVRKDGTGARKTMLCSKETDPLVWGMIESTATAGLMPIMLPGKPGTGLDTATISISSEHQEVDLNRQIEEKTGKIYVNKS